MYVSYLHFTFFMNEQGKYVPLTHSNGDGVSGGSLIVKGSFQSLISSLPVDPHYNQAGLW